MKLYDFGLIAFILFVTNCFQFEAARKACEKNAYEGEGCKVHKEIKDADAKKLKITFK